MRTLRLLATTLINRDFTFDTQRKMVYMYANAQTKSVRLQIIMPMKQQEGAN